MLFALCLATIDSMVKIIIVWVLAAVFTVNSVIITVRTNYNAGTLMMWLASLLLVGYGVFHRPIDAFLEKGFGRVIRYSILGGLALFVGLFLFVALSGYVGNAKGDEKAIVVLGAGLRGEQVSDLLRRRLDAALDLWQQNPEAVIVVTGGQGPQELVPEAVAMKRWLLARGVPEDKIIEENRSESTEENLLFARQLLQQAGISADEPIAVVTNAFHCYRAGEYAKKAGFAQVRTVPASMNITTYLPNNMREILAVLFLWVFRR